MKKLNSLQFLISKDKKERKISSHDVFKKVTSIKSRMHA